MLLRRINHDRLAQYGYLIACGSAKEAIVIDPVRDPSPYLDAARRDGVRITHVTETHVHADFLSGAAALASAASAQLLPSGEDAGAGGYARQKFPHARWLREGDVLRVGAVRLDVMHVPGHTPEHVAFLVTDLAVSEAPMGLVSGDFLFVGDVGRPDLLASRVDELRDAGAVLVHCQGGSRSAVAASVLRAAWIREVSNVAGGYAAWARAGHAPATGE